MRHLCFEEKSLIARIAEKLVGAEKKQLLEDVELATTNGNLLADSQIKFDIKGYTRPPYKGQHLYGAEGKVPDKDGEEIAVLLYADENGRLLELELIRWDGAEITDPQWKLLNIY